MYLAVIVACFVLIILFRMGQLVDFSSPNRGWLDWTILRHFRWPLSIEVLRKTG